jgi:chemosensory pili system protein ChpA (sensor histidine kinase/response regulator)
MAIADDLLLAQLWLPRHGLVGIAERAAWGLGVVGSVATEQLTAGIDDLVFVLEGELESERAPAERDTAAPGNTEAWQKSIQGILDQLLGISRMLLGYLGSGDSSQLDHAAAQFAGLATELQNLSLPVTAEQMALCGRALLEGVIPAVVDDESAPFNEAIAGTVLAVTAYIASLLDDDNDRANRTLRLTHLMALPLREQVGALPVSARETASKIQGLDQQCSEAQDSEEQGMEPLKAPYAETVTGMDNNDGVDPEIRDIFVEEAREVLANLAEDYPRWSSAQGDHGVVQELRRAFHTLKGSGRMAGAMVLGELAWAVERLFNGILDGKLKVEPVTLSLVAEVLTLLPGLVDEFEQGLTCANPQRVTQLQQCVERLVAGQPVNEQDFRVMPAVVAPEPEPLAESAPVGLSEEDLE